MAKPLKSQLKTIKSITTWRYEVELAQNDKLYYVTYCNLLTKQEITRSFIDYSLANSVFEAKLQHFQGH